MRRQSTAAGAARGSKDRRRPRRDQPVDRAFCHSGQPDAALRFALGRRCPLPETLNCVQCARTPPLTAGRACSEEALQAFSRGFSRSSRARRAGAAQGQSACAGSGVREALAVSSRSSSAPHVVEAWRTLASLRATSGLTEAALESSTRALALAPHGNDVALEHAVALLRSGHADTAALRP